MEVECISIGERINAGNGFPFLVNNALMYTVLTWIMRLIVRLSYGLVLVEVLDCFTGIGAA